MIEGRRWIRLVIILGIARMGFGIPLQGLWVLLEMQVEGWIGG